jgi:hypothetical protein
MLIIKAARHAILAALQLSTTRATQPEAALREALKQAGRLLMAIEDTVPIAKKAQGIILAALKDHRHG